ncbi:Alpha/Beta hydrolase protein [Choanephora cucurbitarum]|nr:Alpha/Beta hydrolase protein [Choanephora cucurbitarum]
MIDIRDVVLNAVKDQLSLYPELKIQVVGHSFGAGVGSLITVDLFQNVSQINNTNIEAFLLGKPRIGDFNYAEFVAKNKIHIKRYVHQSDDVPHRPEVQDGYVHEGDEYWLKSNEPDNIQLLFCQGPYETKDCSSSIKTMTSLEHFSYFGVEQECKDFA